MNLTLYLQWQGLQQVALRLTLEKTLCEVCTC